MISLVPIIVLTVIVTAFGILLVTVAAKLGPKLKQSKVQLSSYECGIEEQLSGHSKMPVKFYLTAILFILFDIEIIEIQCG